MATLTFIAGPKAGEHLELTEAIVIGREDCDVVIDDPRISRRHLAIRPHDDGVEIEDLGSSNGTFVDDRKIDAAVRVASGATVRLGATELRVEIDDPSRADATVIGDVGAGGTVIGSSVPEPPSLVAPTVAASAPPAAEAPPAPPPPAPAPRAEPAPAPPPRAPEAPRLAAFAAAHPSAPTRVARSWLPTAVAVAIIAATAAALLAYFAMR